MMRHTHPCSTQNTPGQWQPVNPRADMQTDEQAAQHSRLPVSTDKGFGKLCMEGTLMTIA